MIFIFGYHPVTKTVGPVEEKTCTHCHNTRHWLLSKTTYYISLFFVPVIPTKNQRFMYCPICKAGEELAESEFKSKEPLAKLNSEALKTNMSNQEYEERLKKV